MEKITISKEEVYNLLKEGKAEGCKASTYADATKTYYENIEIEVV